MIAGMYCRAWLPVVICLFNGIICMDIHPGTQTQGQSGFRAEPAVSESDVKW